MTLPTYNARLESRSTTSRMTVDKIKRWSSVYHRLLASHQEDTPYLVRNNPPSQILVDKNTCRYICRMWRIGHIERQEGDSWSCRRKVSKVSRHRYFNLCSIPWRTVSRSISHGSVGDRRWSCWYWRAVKVTIRSSAPRGLVLRVAVQATVRIQPKLRPHQESRDSREES